MPQKCVQSIAIVGAAGNVGQYVTKELLATGKHAITAITRTDSTAKLPEGVKVAKVDYDNKSSIVEALKGKILLVITPMSNTTRRLRVLRQLALRYASAYETGAAVLDLIGRRLLACLPPCRDINHRSTKQKWTETF